MLTNSRGHVVVNIVNGSTFTGLKAADGSLNVFDATSATTPVGLYHPCGAMNITLVTGNSLTGRYAPNGSIYIVNDSTEYGIYHPCGAMNVTGFIVTGAQTLLGAEPNGLALNADDFSLIVRDTITPANNYNSAGVVNSSGDLIGINGLFTYSAPSVKMCLQSDGIFRYGAHNLCLWSEDFSGTNWTNSAGLTRTLSQTDPRGGTTAALYTGFAGGFQTINPGVGTTVVTGLSYTFEIWLIGNGTITLDWNGWVGSTTVSLTGTWQKFSNTAVAQTGTAVPRVISYGGNTATSVTVAFAQLRLTNSNPDYLRTTSTPRYTFPFEYNSSNNPLGIRIEESRTNVTFPSIPTAAEASSIYSGSSIFGVSTYPTVAAGSLVDPFGTTNSIRLTWNGVTARYGTPTALTTRHIADAAQSVVTTVFMRAVSGTVSDVSLVQRQTTGAPIGTVTPTLTTSWQRVTLVSTMVAGNGTCGWYLDSLGTSSIEIIQYDHCVGAFATSPIITGSSTLTRAADNILLLITAFPYSAINGIVAVRYSMFGATAASRVWAIDNGLTAEIINHGQTSATAASLGVFDGGVLQANIFGTSGALNTSNRSAASWAENNFAFTVNGAAVGTDTTGTLPSPTTLRLGSMTTGVQYINGHIRQFLYLPRNRTSDAELQGFLA